MSDATEHANTPAPAKSSLLTVDARTKKRNAAEKRFKAYGMIAIGIGLAFLVFLMSSILRNGLPAFTTTVVQLEAVVTQADIDDAESQLLKTAAYQALLVAKVNEFLSDQGSDIEVDSDFITKRLVPGTGSTLREYYQDNPSEIGQNVVFNLPASTRISRYFDGDLLREDISDSRFLMVADLDIVDVMVANGLITNSFDWNFITGTDSAPDNPSAAGLGASVIGSFFMMLVVLFLALPIGVAASIYLEEFAPKNRWTDLIEVNISNLAAVPSIVFGILGLAVFIHFDACLT